jgi:uncharacterized repeat protein (TIGR02543 family)
MQVISNHCVSCHAGFPVNNEGAWVPSLVTPGQPTNSPLWNSLQGNGGTMPLRSGPLSGPELQAIQNWIANFDQTTVRVVAQPGGAGTVTGDGKFTINSVRTITATPNLGWTFAGWNDGNLTASRNITVPSCDVTYTAFFQPAASSLANASTRLLVQTGNNIGIAGFIITGQSQRVVIRGLGPTLSQFGVEGALSDPVLLLFNQAGQMIASNDDWVTTVVDGTIITGDQVAEIQDIGFAPSSNYESVIIATLPPGNYTAQLQGYNNATGVALVEVNGLPPNSSTNLSNLSTRALVLTGDDVMIGGFIIAGQSQRVVIRALGRTLSRFGVQGVLDNPQLLLFNEGGQLIARNDNWQTTVIDGTIITGNQVNMIQSLGFAPLSVLESVIVATLPPGNYTAILQGVNNTTGVALVEIYSRP